MHANIFILLPIYHLKYIQAHLNSLLSIFFKNVGIQNMLYLLLGVGLVALLR